MIFPATSGGNQFWIYMIEKLFLSFGVHLNVRLTRDRCSEQSAQLAIIAHPFSCYIFLGAIRQTKKKYLQHANQAYDREPWWVRFYNRYVTDKLRAYMRHSRVVISVISALWISYKIHVDAYTFAAPAVVPPTSAKERTAAWAHLRLNRVACFYRWNFAFEMK